MQFLPYILTVAAIMLFMGCAAFLGVAVYDGLFRGIVNEAGGDGGGISTAGSLFLRKLGAANRGIMWTSYEVRLRRQLIRGGGPRGFAPEDILALQELSAFAALLVGVWACYAMQWNLLWGLLVAVAGGAYPLIWVNDQVKKRHHLITRALPYNLDLLTLSVEAGLDFTGSLAKVVEKGRKGPLRDEFQIVLKQLKMGKTREEVLKAFIARVDLPVLTTFVTALIQADKMGTSLGKVLRIQSTQMRIDRTQRAEKLAAEAPVKMLFPLIACIFPTVFMILFGPIIFAFFFTGVGA